MKKLMTVFAASLFVILFHSQAFADPGLKILVNATHIGYSISGLFSYGSGYYDSHGGHGTLHHPGRHGHSQGHHYNSGHYGHHSKYADAYSHAYRRQGQGYHAYRGHGKGHGVYYKKPGHGARYGGNGHSRGGHGHRR